MSLYLRPPGKNWWVKFKIGDTSVRCTTGTQDRLLAQRYELHRMKQEIERQEALLKAADDARRKDLSE